METCSVVIAGGGPTGMMLAAELTLAGVDVAVVERRDAPRLVGSRAGGLHARTLEVLDQRGIADRFLSQGQRYPATGFAGTSLPLEDLPTRHNLLLGLWQRRTEEILAGWIRELGVRVLPGCEVEGFAQDEDAVLVELSGRDRPLRAQWLVGCDGGRSVVRKTAGIEFRGWDPTTSTLLAEVEMREQPELGLRRTERGTQAISPVQDGGRFGLVVSQDWTGQRGEPTLEELRAAVAAEWGTDFGLHSPSWISRFTDMTRQAASYRHGRVLLAGDAAHVHYPVGGQGLNLGVQDAVNLGWKLAQVVKGVSPERLLDTYQDERHPVGARVLRTTMAQTALTRADPRTDALRDTLAELLGLDEARVRIAAELSGLDIRYDLGEGHPLIGRRMPDLDLVGPGGPRRVFSLLHAARPVLLSFVGPGRLDAGGRGERVDVVDASCAGDWELPVLGTVAAPAAVLIRPDGHVAWAGAPDDPALHDALATWFGPPAEA